MKKSSKILVVVLALVLVVSAFALTACGETSKFTTKNAYGLVHGKGYVGIATVEVDKDGKMVSASLDEACFPSQVTLSEKETAKLDQADYATVSGKHGDSVVYATVKVGNIVFKVDTTAKAYKVDGQTLDKYFESAENCKAYATAVLNNEIYVSLKGTEKAGVITKANLLKSLNGYWTGVSIPDDKVNGTSAQGWGTNALATCNYVMENGFEMSADDFTQPSKDYFVDKNGVSTGATWSDFKDYYNLLKTAFEAK